MSPILHCFSGGIDSTSVLLQLAQRKRQVYILRLSVRRGSRWRAEKRAGDAILDWFEAQQGWSPVRVLYGDWRSPSNSLSDIEVVAVFCGDVLRHFPNIADVAVSTSWSDRQDPSHEFRHRSRVELTEKLAGRRLAWTALNWERRRREVIEFASGGAAEALRILSDASGAGLCSMRHLSDLSRNPALARTNIGTDGGHRANLANRSEQAAEIVAGEPRRVRGRLGSLSYAASATSCWLA